MQTKSVLPGYIGIKFKAVCVEKKLPDKCEGGVSTFQKNGRRLLHYDLTPANGGNMSERCENGFLITASGCNLGCIEDDEIVYVEDYSIEKKIVKYRGTRLPSSETFLHGLLYEKREDIFSVIHAHETIKISVNLKGKINETEREEPYGTVELARLCLKTFGEGNDIILLKNHGYVAVGSSIGKATETIINMHRQRF